MDTSDVGQQVRATKIVANAQSNGTKPPHPFPVRELSGNVKRPLLEEMKTVLNFQHLARCVECMIFNWKAGTDMLLARAKTSHYYGERNERIYRGIYNVLLAGAVCFQPYNAPFFQAAKEERVDFLERCAKGSPLTDEQLAYLKQFPVYDYRVDDNSDRGRWKYKEYESLFGEFAQWLVEDGARRGAMQNLGPTGILTETTDDGATFEQDWWAGKKFGHSGTGSIHEIKILIGVYEYFYPKVFSNALRDEFIRRRPRRINPEEIPDERVVTVVIFGDFQLVQISMPPIVEDAKERFLFAKPCSDLPATGTIQVRKILKLIEHHDQHSRDSYPPPPVEFELFSFILRKYLGLKFQANTFECGNMNYRILLLSGDIFQVPNYEDGNNDNLVMYRSPIVSDANSW